jgi:DNA end-binding protein Ku
MAKQKTTPTTTTAVTAPVSLTDLFNPKPKSVAGTVVAPALTPDVAEKSTGKFMLTFAGVALPVAVYKATDTRTIAFNQLHDECKGKLSRAQAEVTRELAPATNTSEAITVAETASMHCKACNVAVTSDHIVKGHELTPGQFVEITAEELTACKVARTDTMTVIEFVPVEQIDPTLYEKTSFLAPQSKSDDQANMGFALLRDVMKKLNRVALVTFASKGREVVAVLRPYRNRDRQEGIVMHELFYDYEVRDFNGWNSVPSESNETMLNQAAELMELQLCGDFEPSEHSDSFTQNVRNVLYAKAQNAPVPTFALPAAPVQSNNLMAALTASLAAAKAAPARVKKAKAIA